jgi:hypothetical protein
MERIFHPYDKWEDYTHGFYDNISGKNKNQMIQNVIDIFSNPSETKRLMQKVISEWKYSCEHNLTNMSMNRIAYLGQASCCIEHKIPSTITMESWNKVDKNYRDIADSIAKDLIKEWEVQNA